MGPKQIYVKLKSRDITPTHVCEVGVYLPETSNIIDFIKDGIKATLVEADPVTVEKIKEYFAGYNITLYPYAVWDKNGTIKLSKAAASTFVTELKSSPALENDKYQIKEEDTFEVECRIFSDLDDGTIDLLSIDIEGSEWYVIKHLKSRPRILSVETHGKYYTNPFMAEINAWIEKNNYIQWYKDGSDTVYVQKGVLTPSNEDKADTARAERKIRWKKFKRIFKKLAGK
ncbi:FkbM family methyltransferase [Chitinophagaceae bacterium MMS25-I14]